ncbi:YIP1 family protein [Primorskyibacter sedentarius]|uniref:YIP1 family protein n=1 Tax=Primorskyibacter sedentarius TaxID=745311 RepID=UPI003EB78027
MNLQSLLQLGAQTVLDPRGVARFLIGQRLTREALLIAFALVVAMNTLLYAGMVAFVPQQAADGVIVLTPMVFMLMLGASVAFAILATTWIGRMMGGAATLEQVAILIIWLQGLRFVAQLALIGLGLILPGAGVLLVVAVALVGLWILINFLDEVEGFASLGKSALLLFLSALAAVVVLSLLMSIFGASTLGLTDYV